MIKRIDKKEASIADFAKKRQRLSPTLSSGGDFLSRLFKSDILLASFGDELNGLFAFTVMPNDRYIECMAALSDRSEAFLEVLDCLKARFKGFTSDWVVTPRHEAANSALSASGAEAFSPLFGYILESPKAFPEDERIKPLSEKTAPEYILRHPTDVYWTAQRVIESENFKVFTAFCEEKLAGYIDVRVGKDMSEPYDLNVFEGFGGKGLKEALLKAAVTAARSPVFMMTEGESEELSALSAAGFSPKPETDNITYRIEI